MMNAFSELDLHPQLVQAVADRGYTTPTPIQSSLIPIMLSGRDVMGQAQTGTGKTAAFSLPLLHNLTPGQGHVQGLVLTPTRELAMQVARAMEEYGRHLGVQVLAVYGGQPYRPQLNRLKKGVDLVIGTPGRLLDLIQRNALDLSRVLTVVLDEADEMLSMGFIDDIQALLDETPTTRQTALLSATLPKEIRRLADRYMRDPAYCAIQHEQRTVATIEQRYYLVNAADKLAALTRLFEVEPISSALIFARTRAGTVTLANALTARGFAAEALNGDMSQDARERVLHRFRNQVIKVLVGTDVAARGLDIDDISHVFNYDLPRDPEVYVHRIGRTGRAGRTGTAISLLTPKERGRLRRIEAYTKQKITGSVLPSIGDIEALRKAQVMEKMTVWLQRGRCSQEREIVAALMADGHDPVAVAAVALKLARAEEKQRPIAPISEVQDRNPGKFKQGGKRPYRRDGRDRSSQDRDKDMVRLTLSTGSVQGIRANHVVSTLARHGDIPGHSIGKIRIREQHTLVDVPEQYVGQVLARKGAYRFGKHRITVERA